MNPDTGHLFRLRHGADAPDGTEVLPDDLQRYARLKMQLVANTSIGYAPGDAEPAAQVNLRSSTPLAKWAKRKRLERIRNKSKRRNRARKSPHHHQENPQMSEITPEIRRLQAHAFGIARDVAAAFETKHNDGSSSAATFRALADHLLTEPEVVRAVTAWAKAIEREVDALDDRPGWTTSAPGKESEHARRLMAKHCSIELRCTLSAHQQEWWALNREREASEADILQVLAAGLRARRVEPGRLMSEAQSTAAVDALRDAELPQAVPGRCRDLARKLRDSVEPRSWIADAWTAGMVADLLEQVANAWDRRPAAGMNFSKVKLRGTGLGLVVLTETARWSGGTHDEYGGWIFSPEAWDKFTTSLSADQPMEILTSPGVSAPESVVHQRCMTGGCQMPANCPQGKCVLGPGERA